MGVLSISSENKENNRGFTFLEVICSLVLMGFIGLFISTFLLRGVESYIFVKENSETSQKVALALTRMNLELRPLTRIVSNSDTSLSYFNRESENGKTISYNSGTSSILLDSNVLMDGVDAFKILYKKDPDTDESNWVAGSDSIRELYEIETEITVSFNEISRTFRTSVYPIYSDKHYGAY
ncbi:MAG: prepilin-type N-terminal cleavage/methylation domain-containing protein [Desulfobacteraceae bacterium]|nr:prepilin-type N-terminal cleavage/methylation domain-containing protein [Desulfobacteraceae bacterium]